MAFLCAFAAASALKTDPTAADLMQVLKSHGWSCPELHEYERKSDVNYVVTCSNGRRYHVELGPAWQSGPSQRETGLSILFDISTETRRLRASDTQERVAAARALGDLGPEARAAVPHLIVALRDQDSQVRSTAATALGTIGAAAEPAVSALAKVVQGDDWDSRAAAITALGMIGPPAKAAVPVLESAARDRDHKIQDLARAALDKITVTQ